MTVISHTTAGVLGSKAQNRATEANMEAAREQRALEERLFHETRGSTGHALLGEYFGGQERQLADDASNFYNQIRAISGSPAEQLRQYQAAIGQYQPMIDASRGTLGDVYNGNLTNARLGYLQPVQESRTNLARTAREGVMQGFNERIAALNAKSAQDGTGTGSFRQKNLLSATIGARQQAAGVMAGANLQNAMDTRDVQDQGANLRLQYMQMPYQQAQQALNLEMMPLAQVQQNYSRSLQPFEFFRMGPGNLSPTPLPMQGADTTWPTILNGIGNANSGLAQLYFSGAFKGGGGTGDQGYNWATGNFG